MFTGTYKFITEASINTTEFAFLYSRLEETDRDFVFTGGTTSWRRLVIPQKEEVIICAEIPEPTGVYATEIDALLNRTRPGVENRRPGGGTDPTSEIPPEFLVTLFYEISATPSNSFFNIFETAGISTHPSGNPAINLDPIYYGFWRESGVLVGLAPWEKPLNCPLLKGLTIPTSLGRIGYSIELSTWKSANYIPSNSTNNLRYQTAGGVDNEPFWTIDQNIAVSGYSSKGIIAYENLVTSGLACGERLNNNAWFGGELPHRYLAGGLVGGSLICVTCDVREKATIDGFLNQVMAYWGIPGELRFLRGANPFGCNINGTGNYPPNPDPGSSGGVFSARFKGRYSKIILNYQAKGRVKELELPIEFPTRATKLKLINALPAQYPYYPALSVDGNGWQNTEQPLVSEAFLGRVGIDKDNIYIAILYGTQREWEQGKLLPDERGISSNSAFPPFPWFPARARNPHIGDGFLNFASPTLARPLKDSWKYCKIFIVNKSTFTITSTINKTNPESLVDFPQLTIDWTILEQQNTPRFVDYYSVIPIQNKDLVSSVELTDPATCGFSGNPICYPQISGTIRGDWTTSEGGSHFFPISSIPNFIKPQSLWSQKDWLFWNLLERPKKPLTNTSYFRFELENQLGGHGRSSISPNRFYIDQTGIPIFGTSTINYRTSENYFGEVVESERLRGTAILGVENSIIKWIRISPYSYPYFEPGVAGADDTQNYFI